MQKWLLVLLVLPLLATAQLKQFEVSEMERPDVAIVQANGQWPDDALLLVYSSLDGLQFRSSMGAVDKQTYNNTAGRYEILVKPVKQMMFVAKPGFMELKVATINPNPKGVFYYSIEQRILSKQNRIDELNELRKEGILTTEQFNTFSEKILGAADSVPVIANPISGITGELIPSRRLPFEKKPPKGSKVFIESDSNGDDRVRVHLSPKLKKVGYWKEVITQDSADFTIELVMNKRGTSGYVLLKTKNGGLVAQSKTWRPGSHPHNGHSPQRGIAGRIITWSETE